MMTRWKASLLAGTAVFALGGVAVAQNPPQPGAGPPASTDATPSPAPPLATAQSAPATRAPSPPAAPPPAPTGSRASFAPSYSAQLPETRGTVQRFTLTPIGELDGVILADGTEVHVPPHLTVQLANAVRVGDTVFVEGYRSPSVPLVIAVSIADTNTGQTVVDNGPPPPGSRPPPPPPGTPAPGAQQVSVQGRVQQQLYGPAGDINGALLDDGTIVRIPPPSAYQVGSLLTAGQILAAQGWELSTTYGRVIDAQAVGPSAGRLTRVAPPLTPGYDAAPAPRP